MNFCAGPRFTLILWVLGITWLTPSSWADPPGLQTAVAAITSTSAERGRAIFSEWHTRHNRNYGDFEVPLSMELIRKPGAKPVQRQLRIRQLEVAEGDQVMVVFDEPAAIRGTALLTHAHLQKDDEQWLFLPAFERVKKITTSNKSGAFVQSEFAYEDLSVPVLDKYTYEYLDEVSCGDARCDRVARRPAGYRSGYSLEIFWFDRNAFRVHQIEYFDRRERPLKTLTLKDYRAYSEQLWKAHEMEMRNLQNGRVTRLLWDTFDFGKGLQSQRDFSVAALRRQR